MTTADPSDGLQRPARPQRRDAQRNRDAIVAAAREVYCDHGLEAPLEEIARRAGVGIGTLYRHFPSRVELLDAVLADTVQAHVDAAEQALAADDPWDGFASYLEATCRLQAARAAGAPDAWRRHLGLLLDGFRAERAHPLPEPPLSPRQVHRAMVILGRRSAGDPR
jgi:AcrR family transcriptional regulator